MTETKSDSLGIFIAANGFLAAVLLVWAQLWTSSGVIAHFPSEELRCATWGILFPSAEYGLAWTYAAVLLAVCASASALANHYGLAGKTCQMALPNVSLALFFTAVEMAILDVGQSMMSNYVRLIQYLTTDLGVFEFVQIVGPSMAQKIPGVLLVATPLFVVALMVSWTMTIRGLRQDATSWRWWYWVPNAVAVLILFELALTVRKEQLAGLYTYLAIGPIVLLLALPLALAAKTMIGRRRRVRNTQ